MDARRLLLASVATAFFVAQLAREDIAIASADETFNRRQIDEAKARLRVGTGSLSDVLNFEIQVNSARSQLIRAKRVYNVAMIGLATLLGLREARFPVNMELARLESETEEELVAPSTDRQIRYALTHRPDIRRTDYAVKRAKSEVGIARAKFYPVLNATGSIDGERSRSAEFESDDFGGSIGLNLTYNLFTGGLNRAQLAEAKSRLTEAERNQDDASIQVASEVQEAVADLIAEQEQLALQRKNARLVQQNRDLVEKEYNAGQTSLVRLNEAQRDLTTAQSRLVLALLSLRQSWENLRAVTGEILNPFELDEPIRPIREEKTDPKDTVSPLYDRTPPRGPKDASDKNLSKTDKNSETATSQNKPYRQPKEISEGSKSVLSTSNRMPESTDQAATKRFYTILLESFRNVNNATKRVEYYQSLGLATYSQKVNIPQKGIFHRVFVGRFEQKQQARQFQTRLQKEFNLDKSLIIRTVASPKQK
jgi:cell division septation protein DedD